MNKLILNIALLLSFCSINGQSEEKILLNEGIEAYKKGQFATALDFFNDSYNSNGAYNKSIFNAANAALLNDSLATAKDLLSEYISISENKLDKSKGYYNIGNIQYNEYEQLAKDPKESQKAVTLLKKSIESYKKAIRNNPNDEDARYNLSLAMSKIPPPSDNQDNQDKKDESKDQENKDEQKDGDGQDKKDQENKDGEKKEDEEKGDQKDQGEKGNQDKEGEKGDQPGEEKEGEKGDEEQKGNQGKEKGEEEMMGKISRMQATKDLEAMNNDEQKTLMKVSRKKGGKQKENSSSKDW